MLANRKQMIEIVKIAGQTLINRAEDIVGDYKNMTSLDIDLSFEPDIERIPQIHIHREIAPKEYFDYIASGQWTIDGRADNE